MDRKKVLKALEDWICKVCEKGTEATPDEIAALPAVASVYFGHLEF